MIQHLRLDDISLIPWTYMVEGENKMSFYFHMCAVADVHTFTTYMHT